MTTFSVRKKNSILFKVPSHSLDLTTKDFFLFLKLENPMKGRSIATIEEIKMAPLEELRAILKKRLPKVLNIGKSASISVLYPKGYNTLLKKSKWYFDRYLFSTNRLCKFEFAN